MLVKWARVTYHVLRLYVCPPIQEEGDGGILPIGSSPMEGGPSTLQQNYTDRQTDRLGTHGQTDQPALTYPAMVRLK